MQEPESDDQDAQDREELSEELKETMGDVFDSIMGGLDSLESLLFSPGRRPGFYVLDGKTPRPARSILEAARAMEGNRRVKLTEIPNGPRVSTVFLGIDHNFAMKGPPILFETMIFGEPGSESQWRCATWEEAEEQHDVAVHFVMALMDQQGSRLSKVWRWMRKLGGKLWHKMRSP